MRRKRRREEKKEDLEELEAQEHIDQEDLLDETESEVRELQARAGLVSTILSRRLEKNNWAAWVHQVYKGS